MSKSISDEKEYWTLTHHTEYRASMERFDENPIDRERVEARIDSTMRFFEWFMAKRSEFVNDTAFVEAIKKEYRYNLSQLKDKEQGEIMTPEKQRILADYKAGFSIQALINKYTSTRNPSKEVRNRQKAELVNIIMEDKYGQCRR